VMQEGAFFEGNLKMGAASETTEEPESAVATPGAARARR
jgi:hypothetical protein